ncbi:MAG: hypothetical protein K2H53_01340 [Clostridia bacterium]|nr:hypothetical protein [Clostridia bacterium]
MGKKKSFEIDSVMDILYGEESSDRYSQFVSGDEGKQQAQEDEVIHISEKDMDYTSFYRKRVNEK